MQTVTDTAGIVHQFPDEATPAMISRALGLDNPAPQQEVRAAPEQISGPMRYVAGVPSMALQGVARGFGAPGDVEHLLFPNEANIFPTSNQLLDVTGRLGLTQRADLIPQPGWERVGAEAIAGVGSALPIARAARVMGSVAPVTPQLVAGAAGGAAGEAVHELMPGSTVAPVAAGLAAGLGVQGIASSFGRGLEPLAARLGSSETLQMAGQDVQNSVRHWKANVMPVQEAAAWAPVDAAIAGHEPVSLTNYQRALDGINKSAPTQQATIDALTSSLPRRLQSALASPATNWQDARAIRTALGNAMANPKLVPDLDPQNVRKLYGAITADLHDTATAIGADDLFNTANAESTRLHLLAEGPFGRIAKGTSAEPSDPNPEAVAHRLLADAKKGASDLAALRAEMPSSVDELAAAHLRTNPILWRKFAPEGQSALVPDDQLRRSIELALPIGKSDASVRTHALEAIAGGYGAHAASILAGHLFPETAGVNPLVTGAAGEIFGMMAPSAYRGARAFVTTPRLWPAPIAGAVGAGNALTSPTQ